METKLNSQEMEQVGLAINVTYLLKKKLRKVTERIMDQTLPMLGTLDPKEREHMEAYGAISKEIAVMLSILRVFDDYFYPLTQQFKADNPEEATRIKEVLKDHPFINSLEIELIKNNKDRIKDAFHRMGIQWPEDL